MGHAHTSAVFRFLNESCCCGRLPSGKAPRRIVIILQSCLCHHFKDRFHIMRTHRAPWRVENNGFEPLTPCLQSRCSSQLS